MRRSQRKRFLTAVALACSSIASIASADDLVVAEAKQRMAEGKQLYAAGQYDAAWLKYKQACVVIKSDNCARGLAVTELKSKRWLDAYVHFRELLIPTPKPSLTPPVVAELTRMMQEAYAKTGHISVRIDGGATLALDGVTVPDPPGDPVDVAAGGHVLESTHQGKTRRLEVTAPEGALVQVDLTIPSPAEPPEAIPTLKQPIPQPPVAVPVQNEPHDGDLGGPIVKWGLTGVAAVSLGLAVGFGVESHSDKNSAASYIASHPGACASPTSAACNAANQLVNSENGTATVSDVFLGVGIATAVGATLAWIFWPKPRDAAVRAWVVPAIGPTGAGVQAGGLFF